jgi:manganese/zinc/iron transport system permease protein
LSGFFGVLISALVPRVPTGPIIVLVASTIFLVSMLFGSRRGVVRRLIIQRSLNRRVGHDDLLRTLYEVLEPRITNTGHPDLAELTRETIDIQSLVASRSWTAGRLQGLVNWAKREGIVQIEPNGRLRLTADGAAQSWRTVRNHRMWELFLIHYADIAPSHVDRDADLIEHVLEPELIAELEALMAKEYPETAMPVSPHPIEIAPVEKVAGN